jgi:hypothetical protein
MPFHQGNMMSNKPHLRPHQKKRQASQITRLLAGIFILAIFALVIALEATGHIVFRGRLILLCGEPLAVDVASQSPRHHFWDVHRRAEGPNQRIMRRASPGGQPCCTRLAI